MQSSHHEIQLVEPEDYPLASPRLAPLERPRGLLPRILGAFFRLQLGKEMSPIRVLYSRIPGMVLGQMLLQRFSQNGLRMPPEVKHLIEQRTCLNNGCTFCADLVGAVALYDGCPEEDLAAAENVDDLPPRSRAVVSYVDEVCHDKTASEATFAALKQHFDDRIVAEVVWLTAWTSYHNLLALPLGLSNEGFCDIVRAKRGR